MIEIETVPAPVPVPLPSRIVITLDRDTALMLLVSLGVQTARQISLAVEANGAGLKNSDVQRAYAKVSDHYVLYTALKAALAR